MSYADLATIQVTDPGDVLTAAWCDQVRDNSEFHIDPPACSVYASAAKSVTSGTITPLEADLESYDNDSMHSTSTNEERVTIQTAGRYTVSATVRFAAALDTTDRLVQFYVNGATQKNSAQFDAADEANRDTIVTAYRTLVLAEGDYVVVRVRQSSGGNLDVTLDEFLALFQTR